MYPLHGSYAYMNVDGRICIRHLVVTAAIQPGSHEAQPMPRYPDISDYSDDEYTFQVDGEFDEMDNPDREWILSDRRMSYASHGEE